MKQVLFVCIHNSGRSQMAEAFYNRLAAGNGRAVSAGTMPASALNLQVVAAMLEIGMDIRSQKPKLLTEELVQQADCIITMGCDVDEACPAGTLPTEDWGLDDPAGRPLAEVRRIRDQILARVQALLEKAGPESPA